MNILPRLTLGDSLTVSFIGNKDTWRKLTGDRGTVLRQKFRKVRTSILLCYESHLTGYSMIADISGSLR